LVRAMVMGWDLDMIDPSSKPEISQDKLYDFSAMVPLQLHNSIDKIANIKKLIVGGGNVAESLNQKLQALDTEVFETYGMTETITHVAVRPLNKAAGLSDTESGFMALPNVFFSQDQRDCLMIEAKKVSDDIIKTNDVVDLKSKIRFEWLARFDHVINTGGLKFFPEQIEKKLEALVEDSFFITGLRDEVLGERIVLFVEGQQNEGLRDKLKAYQKKYPKKLSKNEIPRDIYFVKSFQRTETDKIDRNTTVKLYLSSI